MAKQAAKETPTPEMLAKAELETEQTKLSAPKLARAIADAKAIPATTAVTKPDTDGKASDK